MNSRHTDARETALNASIDQKTLNFADVTFLLFLAILVPSATAR